MSASDFKIQLIVRRKFTFNSFIPFNVRRILETMIEHSHDSPKLIAILLLTIMTALAYFNTFNASWHFDDYPNLVQCEDIRVSNLKPGTLFKAYLELENGNHRQRPITWLSFALNWYWAQDNVVGYHVVNLLIHLVASVFLFLCCRHILSVYMLHKSDDQVMAILAAFLSAGLWSLHPIQTQAVTYVVQRMASLAGMFYIMAFYLFLKGVQQKKFVIMKSGLYVAMGICFLLALGSKPSSAMFPVVVGLFYAQFEFKKRQNLSVGVCTAFWAGVSLVVGFAVWYYIGYNPLNLLGGYSIRPFSLLERLLTEGRVLVHYLMQLALLKPFSFSLVHEISISTSLFSPLSTLTSLLFISLLIGLSWFLRKRASLFSFSIMFFFINHIVESTFLPLELVYEHRNYIPSMFLFLPLSYSFVRVTYSRKEMIFFVQLRYLVPTIIMIALIGLTIHRNSDWHDEHSFWSDAINKSPGLARPYHNLAHDYYERIGDYETAIKLYLTALTKSDLRPDHKAYSYNNIASLYYRMGENEKAFDYVEKALHLNSEYEFALYNKCLILISMDQSTVAEGIAKSLTEDFDHNLDYRALYGFVLMKNRRYGESEKQLSTVVGTNPFHLTALMHLGVLQGIMGQFQKAEKTLSQLCEYSPSNVLSKLCLLDLYSRNDRDIMNKYKEFVLRKHEPRDLIKVIHFSKTDRLAPLLDYTELEDVFKQ